MYANNSDTLDNLIQSSDETTATGAEIASYGVLMRAIPIVLYFHLLSTALGGLRNCNLDQLSPEHPQVINQFGLSQPQP